MIAFSMNGEALRPEPNWEEARIDRSAREKRMVSTYVDFDWGGLEMLVQSRAMLLICVRACPPPGWFPAAPVPRRGRCG